MNPPRLKFAVDSYVKLYSVVTEEEGKFFEE